MYKPLGRNIIIERLEEEKVSKSGIILVANKEVCQVNDLGKVLAISKDIDNGEIKIDDIVIFAKYAGSTVKFNDKECLIIDIDDILAVKEMD